VLNTNQPLHQRPQPPPRQLLFRISVTVSTVFQFLETRVLSTKQIIVLTVILVTKLMDLTHVLILTSVLMLILLYIVQLEYVLIMSEVSIAHQQQLLHQPPPQLLPQPRQPPPPQPLLTILVQHLNSTQNSVQTISF
jgi:hypothetical protein